MFIYICTRTSRLLLSRAANNGIDYAFNYKQAGQTPVARPMQSNPIRQRNEDKGKPTYAKL